LYCQSADQLHSKKTVWSSTKYERTCLPTYLTLDILQLCLTFITLFAKYLLGVWSRVLHEQCLVCQPTHFKEPEKSLHSKSSPLNPNMRSENSVRIIMILIFKTNFNIIFLSMPQQLHFLGFQPGVQCTKKLMFVHFLIFNVIT